MCLGFVLFFLKQNLGFSLFWEMGGKRLWGSLSRVLTWAARFGEWGGGCSLPPGCWGGASILTFPRHLHPGGAQLLPPGWVPGCSASGTLTNPLWFFWQILK